MTLSRVVKDQMNEHALKTLEFHKVVGRLAALTAFLAGRELALALRPSSDRQEVIRRHTRVVEGRRLQVIKPALGFGGAHDLRPQVQKAALGGQLDPAILLQVQDTLRCARTWRRTLDALRPTLPLLAAITDRFDPLESLIDLIGRSVTGQGEIADGASAALGLIRRQVHVVHDRLVLRMNHILGSAAGRLVAQEPIVTQRAGRYVIPIKAEMRGQFRGVVHDVSQSGATLFIEPLEVVDLANEWRELQLEEEREVERILRELSAAVGAVAGQIEANVEALAELDLVYASVRLGDALGARELLGEGAHDWLVEQGELRLVNARHPLLTGKVVPITIAAGGEDRVLLITGPNTGGKTVALKTAGLLTLMALAGLPLPAERGSQVPVYREVFADIGDEQSIEQSLSTFSSHMRNIIEVVRRAGDASLVLLDELGAGTDPEEGAALAQAIIRFLLGTGATVIATTHHGQLKVFAHETEGVRNASVEFDPETLAPTYRLTIGLPGRSNAIAIAARLGMPEAILDDASGALSPGKVRIDALLREIHEQREQAETERSAAAGARTDAEAARDRWQQELAGLEARRAELLQETAAEMERELADTRAHLRRAARRLPSGPAEGAREETATELKAAEAAPRRLRRRLGKARRSPGIEPPQVAPGDCLWLRGLATPGEALSSVDERGEIEALFGSLRTRVRVEQVERVERPPRPRAEPSSLPPVPEGPREIEIRAQRVDEALPRLERFLDEAFRTGHPSVRIVHGKGTGTLRRVVRELLAAHPLVTSFETAERREGGEGVTIAHLAV